MEVNEKTIKEMNNILKNYGIKTDLSKLTSILQQKNILVATVLEKNKKISAFGLMKLTLTFSKHIAEIEEIYSQKKVKEEMERIIITGFIKKAEKFGADTIKIRNKTFNLKPKEVSASNEITSEMMFTAWKNK